METTGVLRLPIVAHEMDQKLIFLPLLYFILRFGNSIFIVLFSVCASHLGGIAAQLAILLVVRGVASCVQCKL